MRAQPDPAEAVVAARLLAAGGRPSDVAPLLHVTPKHIRRTLARALDAREDDARATLAEITTLRATLRLSPTEGSDNAV
jgi:hypothetical protein